MTEVKKNEKPKKICTNPSCSRELSLSKFYNSESPMFPDKKSPFCKDCIKKMVDSNDIQSVYNMLRNLDIPFLYEYWSIAVAKKPENPFGKYITMANSLKQFKNKRWTDSEFDCSKGEEGKYKEINDEKEEKIYSKDWLGKYTQTDIDYLDRYFQDLKRDFKIVTRNHIDYAKKIAKASLAMDRAYEDMLEGVQGADTRYKNLKDTFDQLSKSAQFSEDKRGANDVSLGAFGVVFELVEKKQWIPKHTPLEKDDFDKMIEAFSTIEKSL